MNYPVSAGAVPLRSRHSPALLALALALAGLTWGHGVGAADPAQPASPAVLPDTSPAAAVNLSPPPVTAPPAEFFELVAERDREAARRFYRKHIDVKGMPVAAAAEVEDAALRRAYELVTRLLAGRPDLFAALVKDKMYLIIIGRDQVYTDMPEYRNHPDPAFQNLRVRGTGGRPTSFGEENLLSLPIDRYDDESIGLHEFCHTIDGALSRLDPAWRRGLRELFQDARSKGLWENTYSASNAGEYWAESVTMYFDCDRPNNWNHGPVWSREQLRLYDPGMYAFIRQTLRLTPQQDWRYRWLQPLPNVIPPPAQFHFNPYYTQFTYAREFPVLGSGQVSAPALLKANDTVRKMFAYRHDILKALIDDGARLVVLGRDEKLSDLPEFKTSRNVPGFDEARYQEYTPELKLLVVPEENVLNLPREPFAGECMVVNLFAKALHHVTGLRPADPDFERRPDKQQYELRVKRMDLGFDARLEQAYTAAMTGILWKGTAAARDRVAYWAAGVTAYFDAAGEGQPCPDADHPIVTREALRAYDPGLYLLVDETMAYQHHVDWRFQPCPPRAER